MLGIYFWKTAALSRKDRGSGTCKSRPLMGCSKVKEGGEEEVLILGSCLSNY